MVDERYPLGPPVAHTEIAAASDGAARPTPAAPPQAAVAVAAPPTAAAAEPQTLDPDRPMPKESVTTDATLKLGEEAHAMLDARSDVFSAGLSAANLQRGGKLPARITLAPGGGAVLFSSVHGRIGCSYHSNYGPDGGSCAFGHTRLTAAGSVSGIVDLNRTMFVTGVFLSDKPGRAPRALDFSDRAHGMSFTTLAPELGQLFFIGDGLTGTETGSQQRFAIPQGATALYLGFADGQMFQGEPGAYIDNTGSVALGITQAR